MVTKKQLAQALHDHQNYPFPMPKCVSFEKLKKKARKEYIKQAEELIEIMQGYESKD